MPPTSPERIEGVPGFPQEIHVYYQLEDLVRFGIFVQVLAGCFSHLRKVQ